MHVERGHCFNCNSAKVLNHNKKKQCETLFLNLFNKTRVGDFTTIEKLMELKWCPLCFHKLLQLTNHQNIFASVEKLKYRCVFCQSKNNIMIIETWPHLGKVLEEFPVTGKSNVCLDCIYLADIRYHLKEKLVARFPQLKTQYVKSRSSSVQIRPKRKIKPEETIVLSSDEEKNESFPISKKFKPLKHTKLKNLKYICKDPKFYSKVPFVKLRRHFKINKKELHKSSDENGQSRHSFFKIKLKSFNNKYSIIKNRSKSPKMISKSSNVSFYSEDEELRKYNIKNSLVIYLNSAKEEGEWNKPDINVLDNSEVVKSDSPDAIDEVEQEEKVSSTSKCEDKPTLGQKSFTGENLEEDDLQTDIEKRINELDNCINQMALASDSKDDVSGESCAEKTNDKIITDDFVNGKTKEVTNLDGIDIENKESGHESHSENYENESEKNKNKSDVENLSERLEYKETDPNAIDTPKKKYKPKPLSKQKKKGSEINQNISESNEGTENGGESIINAEDKVVEDNLIISESENSKNMCNDENLPEKSENNDVNPDTSSVDKTIDLNNSNVTPKKKYKPKPLSKKRKEELEHSADTSYKIKENLDDSKIDGDKVDTSLSQDETIDTKLKMKKCRPKPLSKKKMVEEDLEKQKQVIETDANEQQEGEQYESAVSTIKTMKNNDEDVTEISKDGIIEGEVEESNSEKTNEKEPKYSSSSSMKERRHSLEDVITNNEDEEAILINDDEGEELNIEGTITPKSLQSSDDRDNGEIKGNDVDDNVLSNKECDPSEIDKLDISVTESKGDNEAETSILSNKRKSNADLLGELIFSPDKKKKRVTFSDDVMESYV